MNDHANGAVASGHSETTKAGARMLAEGGNAFDAILASLCASCVVEPVLSSLGGGGFLLAKPAGEDPVLYDFFTQTPKNKNTNCDFYPITADFGTVTQDFHIGHGSVATPGVVKGIFETHKDLCRLPIDVIMAPAIELARNGVKVNPMQGLLFDVVEAIFTASPPCKELYGSSQHDGLLRVGETQTNPQMADFFEALSREGEALFYEGEIAQKIADISYQEGGHLTLADLRAYDVKKRQPLKVDYGSSHFYTNPPPSTGGLLIAFALELLKDADLGAHGFDSAYHVERLSQIMALTNKARLDHALSENNTDTLALLNPDFLHHYKSNIFGRPSALRGTTHMSAIDAEGNCASLTVSNGEGCGHILPGTGVMLNNMLGEEDINPNGFHQWEEDTRMCSMMAPTLLINDDGTRYALGSGGSNRIRTAVLQVLLNLLEYDMSLEAAVNSPRMHYEHGTLNVEPGFSSASLGGLDDHVAQSKLWPEKNLFFGGVHSVRFKPQTHRFDGAGDIRRGGTAIIVDTTL